jgi:hypothetical protein
MALHYTTTYTALATNVSTTQLAVALAAVPRDVDTETLLGLSLVSDTTTTSAPNIVQRRIVLSDAAIYPGAPIPPGAPMAEVLTDYYRGTFGQALSTPVTASAVIVS